MSNTRNAVSRPGPSIGKVKTRSKVFSGTVRNSSNQIPRLEDLCIQVLMANHHRITYLGDAPYYLIKPVLAKCSPAQLFNLEDYNPRITEDDDELWKWHCHKEFKEVRRKEDESWRDLYIRAEIERNRKLERITRTIDMKEKSKGPARRTQLAFTDSEPKPPRNIRKLQEKTGVASASASSPSTSSSCKNTRSSTAPSLQPAKKQKGFLMKNCLKMMQSIRRQNS